MFSSLKFIHLQIYGEKLTAMSNIKIFHADGAMGPLI